MAAQPLLTLGYSPCPNDTYIFNALVNGQVELAGARLAQPELEDVETLNEWAMATKLDITKVSFHAYGHIRQNYRLLPTGAALGRGCGPLLITGPFPSRLQSPQGTLPCQLQSDSEKLPCQHSAEQLPCPCSIE